MIRTVLWFTLCHYFHTITIIIMSEKELEFAQCSEADCEAESTAAVGLHILFSAFPYLSQSLLYSETGCDQLPGAGLAM